MGRVMQIHKMIGSTFLDPSLIWSHAVETYKYIHSHLQNGRHLRSVARRLYIKEVWGDVGVFKQTFLTIADTSELDAMISSSHLKKAQIT